jgi:hypothetical protein
MRLIRPRTAAVAALLVAACAVVGMPADARVRRGSHHHRRFTVKHNRTSDVIAPPLAFGIYPGGAAGTVGPSGPLKPEDPVKRLAALEQLQPPGRPFVLHLYAGYPGPEGWSAAAQVGAEVSRYTAAGLEVELALTYRPSDGGSPADVAGFVDFVRAAVRSFGSNRRFVSLQVTNEANVHGAPDASDGWYSGASDALIAGVIAAKAQAVADGFGQIRVGFNWAYQRGPAEDTFWGYIGSHGGHQFVASLDWVGFDAYPGTWGPSVDPHDLSGGSARFMLDAVRSLRNVYLPLAGIPASVPLHVSESGYPTGPGRTEAMQVAVMESSVAALDAARAAYNITDYRWFDLRDADSSSTSFESHYGLLRDDYSPKAGFEAYRALVARLSAPHLNRRQPVLRRSATPRRRPDPRPAPAPA